MLQLRVFGESSAVGEVAKRLGDMPGARHVGVVDGARKGSALVTADVGASVADGALKMVRAAGIPAEDISLLRLDAIGPAAGADEPVTQVWADLLGQARINARTTVLYLVYMAVAGVIGAFGVIDEDQILIVGAMAVAPDLLPITAACTGLVLGRGRLFGRGLAAMALGLGTACVLAALVAGVAGMLAVETRASMAVGVAISVTTIPAAAFLGVAVGVGQLSKSLGALGVLATNVAMMITGGSAALVIQRRLASRSD